MEANQDDGCGVYDANPMFYDYEDAAAHFTGCRSACAGKEWGKEMGMKKQPESAALPGAISLTYYPRHGPSLAP